MKSYKMKNLLSGLLLVASVLHASQSYSREFSAMGGEFVLEKSAPFAIFVYEIFKKKETYPPVEATSVKESNAPGKYDCDAWGNRRVNNYLWEKC